MKITNETKLLLEICDIAGVKTQEIREKLVECLSKYKIQSKETYHSFSSCVDLFINAKTSENLSKKTIKNYKERLALNAKYFNDKPPAQITVDEIRGLITYWNDNNIKKTSIQTYINYTRNFFNWLHNEELIPSNPFTKIKSYYIDKTASRKPMQQYDLERFRSSCEDIREKALVEFFVSTGCRVGELINIKVSDIDWSNRTLEVVGKGDKTRTIIFSMRTKVYLEDYLASKPKTEYLFTSKRRPFGKLTKEAIEKVIRTVASRANISESVYPHKLRHTFASNALNAGMQISTIQNLLGHTNLSTTQIYAKIRKETVISDYNKYIG